MADAYATKVVLRLTVKNHPGAMSHICGLFSRRAFNLDALICHQHSDVNLSIIWLLVARDTRIDQMIRQLQKLEDVSEVVTDQAPTVFQRLSKFMHEPD